MDGCNVNDDNYDDDDDNDHEKSVLLAKLIKINLNSKLHGLYVLISLSFVVFFFCFLEF